MKYIAKKHLNAPQVKVNGASRHPRCMTPMKLTYVISVGIHFLKNALRFGLAKISERKTLCAGFTPAHAPFAAAAASLFTALHNSTALSTPSCPSLFQTTASSLSSPSSITPGAVMLRVFVPILGIATVCVVDTARVQNDHRIIRQSSRIARRPLAFVRVVRVFAPSRDPLASPRSRPSSSARRPVRARASRVVRESRLARPRGRGRRLARRARRAVAVPRPPARPANDPIVFAARARRRRRARVAVASRSRRRTSRVSSRGELGAERASRVRGGRHDARACDVVG